jgi:hypothetical protein
LDDFGIADLSLSEEAFLLRDLFVNPDASDFTCP